MSPSTLTSALLAQQAIAAAASAPVSRPSSRPRTLSRGKLEDVCDSSDASEEADTDSDSDDESDLVDEFFLDPDSDEGIATKVAAYARHLSAPAKRFLRSFPVDVLRDATAYFERLEEGDLVLEARKGDNSLCLRRTNYEELCEDDGTTAWLSGASQDRTIDLVRVDGFETVPIGRRHPHPPSPADDSNPHPSVQRPRPRQPRAPLETGGLASPPPFSTSSAPAPGGAFDFSAFRASAAASNALVRDSFFPESAGRRGTTALGRLLAEETPERSATSEAGGAVTTVEQDGSTSTLRVTAPERGIEFEMVLYEEEEVEEEQGLDDPAAEEAEREREEADRREGRARAHEVGEIGR